VFFDFGTDADIVDLIAEAVGAWLADGE
jgi:hypothetical protein